VISDAEFATGCAPVATVLLAVLKYTLARIGTKQLSNQLFNSTDSGESGHLLMTQARRIDDRRRR
jgi:hypothetical protein